MDARGERPGVLVRVRLRARGAAARERRRRRWLELRGAELTVTLAILDELLAEPLSPANADADGAGDGPLGVAQVKSPARGDRLCGGAGGGSLARLHLRTGSCANWPALAHATADNLLPDFPLINKSFELCYACVDR